MTTLTYAARDSATLLRRNLRHLVRYPSLTLMIIGMPVVFLLLFVYVFGGTLGAGLPGGSTSADPRADYLLYLTPAILVMTVVSVANSTAILVAKDATEGIIDRFRTLPIARSAPLTGHVLAAMAQTVFGIVVVLAIALGAGLPQRRLGRRLGRCGRHPPADGLGGDLAVRRARAGQRQRRGGQQRPDAADPAAVPLQRVRADRLDAERPRVGRRAPAVHADHRDPPGLPRRPRPGSDLWWAIGWCVLITALCFWWATRLFARVRAS